MIEKTCAACDCKLDAEAINVTVGGKTVEVCCEECAVALREADASMGRGDVAASRLASIVLGALLVLAPIASGRAAPADMIRIADVNAGQTLTLASAKQFVARWLNGQGEQRLRPGHAEFDRDGNVAVEVVSAEGIAVGRVMVDGKTGSVAAELARKSRRAVD